MAISFFKRKSKKDKGAAEETDSNPYAQSGDQASAYNPSVAGDYPPSYRTTASAAGEDSRFGPKAGQPNGAGYGTPGSASARAGAYPPYPSSSLNQTGANGQSSRINGTGVPSVAVAPVRARTGPVPTGPANYSGTYKGVNDPITRNEAEYASYGEERPDRELTQQEIEEREVAQLKGKTKATNADTIRMLREAIAAADEATVASHRIQANLDEQGEILYTGMRDLVEIDDRQKEAKRQAERVKALNGSFAAFNPFLGAKQTKTHFKAAEADYLDKTAAMNRVTEAQSKAKWDSRRPGGRGPGASAASSSRRDGGGADGRSWRMDAFEPDSEDEGMAQEFEEGIKILEQQAAQLHEDSRNIGRTLGKHTEVISQMDERASDAAYGFAKTNYDMAHNRKYQ